MFGKILLASDGSAHANRAAELALNLARKLADAHVTLFHVCHTAPSRNRLQNGCDVLSMLKEEAHRSIIRTELKFRNAGVPYTLEVSLGKPADEIVKLANSGDYDLVIIGSRGLSKLKELVLGSVSHKVTHEAKCPVMIVK